MFIISAIYFFTKGYKLICGQIEEILRFKKINQFNNKNAINFENKYKEFIPQIISSSENNKINKSNIKFLVTPEINLSKGTLNNKISKIKEKTTSLNNINYEEFEMNNISYSEALKIDKRTFCEFYLSLIKVNHIVIFTFNPNKDYNPYIVKICLFFFLFYLQMFVNALFFNDSTLHEIFEDKGVFNFSYVLPHIFYTVIICSIFNAIFKYIYLIQKDILGIKHEKNINLLNARVVNTMNCLKIKFLCFFIINIILLLFFWYYLSCFYLVYKKTQLYLIKVILISYSFSLIYNFCNFFD